MRSVSGTGPTLDELPVPKRELEMNDNVPTVVTRRLLKLILVTVSTWGTKNGVPLMAISYTVAVPETVLDFTFLRARINHKRDISYRLRLLSFPRHGFRKVCVPYVIRWAAEGLSESHPEGS